MIYKKQLLIILLQWQKKKKWIGSLHYRTVLFLVRFINKIAVLTFFPDTFTFRLDGTSACFEDGF